MVAAMKDIAQIRSIVKGASSLSLGELKHRMRKFAVRVPASVLRLSATTAEEAVEKVASLGGDPESGFEQSFAQLAYQYISEKAPGLMDYMIGFQLVDRNEDNTKAVGVFGFKVGEQWMYAPVFFLSNDIKGHELLYLKQQNMFVPLKENWINYLVNKKPQILGEGTPDSMQQLGAMHPNVTGMIMPPFAGKYAAAPLENVRPWARECGLFQDLGKLAFSVEGAEHADAFFGGTRPVKSALDLRGLLDQDLRYVVATMAMCSAFPGVKVALDTHYGKDFLEQVLTGYQTKVAAAETEELAKPAKILRKVPPTTFTNRSRLRKKGSILKGAVADDPASPKVDKTQIITENVPLGLTEEERRKLLEEGHLIKDERKGEEFTVEYNTQVSMTLSNPDITGVYEVLTKVGDFEKCLVIFAPYGETKRQNFVTVVRLGDNKAWKNLAANEVFIRQGSDSESQDGKLDWFEKLPAGTESPAQDAVYVAVTASGQGTCPFEINQALSDGAYEVYWRDYGPSRYSGGPSSCGDHTPTIRMGQRKGHSIMLERGTTYLPESAKLIKIKDPPKCTKCDKVRALCSCEYFRGPRSEDLPIEPGSLADLQLAMRHKTSELKVVDDHCEAIVGSVRMAKKAALFHLVRDHGLSESDAKRMLKEAELFHGARWRVQYAPGYPRVKQADPYGPSPFPPPSAGGEGFATLPPDMPNYAGGDMGMGGYGMSAPVQEPWEQQQQVPGLEAGMTDPNIYNPMMVQDPMAAQMAQQAGQTGQKEVFDTAMLSSLTKLVHPENKIDKDLGNIAKTLNTLGTMLFMFYWHNNEFQDRYGKKDLPELEDTLRNSFEMLGDLLLKLKQKTVDTMFGSAASMAGAGPNVDHASDY